MNKLIPLNPFTNVVATGLAICDLNNLLGTTVEAINLTLGGTSFTKSMITMIQLKANGKIIFETDGSKLDAAEQFKNYPADAARLCLNFMERQGRTINAFQAGSIDLSRESGITNLRLEVTTSGATAPTLVGVAELSPAMATPGEEAIRFLMQRRHRTTQSIAASGQKIAMAVPHIDPAGGGSVFKRCNFYSQFLTSLQVVRSGIVEFDLTTADLAQIQKRAGRLPQANLVVLDFILDNIMSGRLWDTRPSAQCTQAIIYGTFSNTETITIETEELIPLGMY